jgi:hypothetical protein
LEDRVLRSWSGKEELLTDEEEELMRQDDEAKHFLIMWSCRGDAFAIIESHKAVHQMYQALKDPNNSKETKERSST